MPYREIHIGNEIFVARVTPEAIDEWLGIRERNKEIGYPDRPPDVDTPLVRSWILHPNEINALALEATLPREGDSFPIYTITATVMNSLEIKLLVTFFSDKNVYTFRHVLRSEKGVTIGDVSFSVSEEEASDAFAKEIKNFALVTTGFEYSYFITTFTDFEEVETESILAIKELGEYYGTNKMVN